MKVYRNDELQSTEVLDLKSGSSTEYVASKSLQANDEVIFDVSGLEMGYAQLKDGHVAPVEKPVGSNRIKVQHSLTYNFFLETGNVEGGKKRIWVNANYMMLCHPEQEWTYTDVAINPEPGKSKEYKITGLELSVGDRFVFNVSNGWYHFGNTKSDCDFIQFFESDDMGNFVCKNEGTYDFTVDTTNGPENLETHELTQSITIGYHTNDDAKLLIKGGSPIALDSKSTHEFVVYNVLIEEGTEFIAAINDAKFGFEDLKTGAASGNYGQGSEESTGVDYLRAKGDLTVSIYVDLNADDDGNHIWIDANFMLVKKYIPENIYTNIGLNPEDSTQYKASDVSLGVGDEVVFFVNGKWYHHSDIETTNPYVYSHFENVESSGNIKVKIAKQYTFFVKPVEGTIWINTEITNITYTFEKGDEDWDYLTGGAKFYMWAFEYIGQKEEECRWLEGVNTGTSLTFTIPSNWRYAQVVRLKGDSVITDLNHWNGVDAATEKWNRTQDGVNVWLSGVNSNIHFYLTNW